MARRRTDFLDLRPAHIGTFPCRRQYREEPIASIVACKIHHVEIAKTRISLDIIERIGHSKFTANLVYDNAVNAPVESILRCRFTHDHDRCHRVNRSALQDKAVFQGVLGNVHFRKGIVLQISPIFTRNVNIQKVTRSICALCPHATPIRQAACTCMGNHEHALCIRIFGKRVGKRGTILRLVRGHDAGFIVLGSLFAFHLLGTIVVDHRLVDFENSRPDGRLDINIAATGCLVISIRICQMLFPIMHALSVFRRVQIIRRRIGIKSPRTGRQRIVRRFLLELHTQHINIERIHGMCQREHA